MTATKIGILGSGQVGEALANGFLKHGDQVMRGSRDPAKLGAWAAAAGPRASSGTFEDAARFGDVVVLAVKGAAAESLVASLAGALAGKVVLDTTNPLADAPPVNGVLRLFTGPNESLMERLQASAPRARFVKAFSCVGNALMVNPALPGGMPTMFVCGNDAAAKAVAREILERFGWECEDLGAVEAARAIEPLVSLWCLPGFLRNDWAHAFKLLRR
jgi:predicted dinucleotide-binding enzyme